MKRRREVSGLTRELMALRIAQELKDGMYINLGIGLPTMVSQWIPKDRDVVFQSENGILGYGPIAEEHEEDPDLVNAGAQPVTLLPGASFFHSADSFTMIRGGHVDVTVLGAYQVSEKGDLANWTTSEEGIGSIGGAMDLACGAKQIWVAMEHTTPSGKPRIVEECNYPLTARAVVRLIFTNLALIEVISQGLMLRELAPGISVAEVQKFTQPRLLINRELREMEL
jgi:3-oxoacid CoA-transferase B subunit